MEDKKSMNILIVGNGFDLAHGLPTRYEDFFEFLKDSKTIAKCCSCDSDKIKKFFRQNIMKLKYNFIDVSKDIATYCRCDSDDNFDIIREKFRKNIMKFEYEFIKEIKNEKCGLYKRLEKVGIITNNVVTDFSIVNYFWNIKKYNI